MTFDEVLAQIIEVLKRQRRVSYGALKRRYDLDDAYLEDLKDEIIKAQRLAIDEDGSVLVWTGDIQTGASPPTQTPPQPTAQVTQSADEYPPAEPHTPEAERRQLTVMFCDLVDSTRLSSQLDPEDYREVVREYQKVCSEVIQRFDGHIAQYLGDGLLVYFGYPQAHEDDAQRAVRAGIGMLDALGDLNKGLPQAKGVHLAIRVGVHTGLVVVGEMGGAGARERLALGEVPNIASRIEGLAAPHTVTISEATFRLVQGYFNCQELGEQTLRGVIEPVSVYRVLRESGVQSRLDVASTRGLTPLVGRESEVSLLLERWEQTKAGQGQVILLSGEAGIGKSRLVQVLKNHVTAEPHTRWECRSLPYYQNTALYPITDLLQRALQWQQDDIPERRVEKLEQELSRYRLPLEETVPLFAPLLSLPIPDNRYPPLNLSPQRQRQKTLESIVAILLELAEREPVLFILEDLHWTDPTTLEFLALLVEQVPTTAIYTLLTCRPEFQPSWSHRSYLTEITVNRLSRNQIERIAEQVAGGKRLPGEVLQQIVEKTDGVPLYVEEMTKAILESGHLKAINGHYELTGTLPALAIPSTLQDSLTSRLDRLVTAKGIAQLGATIGRQFSYALLHAVAQLDEQTLQRELGRLVEAELLYQRGLPPQATYMFKHALIQGAAYQSLLRSTRQQYHQRIGHLLEARFPEIVETQPELLAYHFTAAGDSEQAVHYWQQAGQRAIERSANAEAIAHLSKGVELLETLPATPERTRHEIMLHLMLGSPLTTTTGYASLEVERVYTRAWNLCQHGEETPQRISVLFGLYRCYMHREQIQKAQALAEQILSLAQKGPDQALLLEAHISLGVILYYAGDFVTARTHLESSLTLYRSARCQSSILLSGVDSSVNALSNTARMLWMLGYPEQALQSSREAQRLSQALAHPYSQVLSGFFAATIHGFRRERQMVHELSLTVIALAREQGFPLFGALGTIVQGWSLVTQGRAAEGIVQLRQGLTALQAMGEELERLWFLTLLADAYATGGAVEEGLRVLGTTLTLVAQRGDRWWEAEMHRLKGDLLLQLSSDNQPEAESCFHQSIAIAQNQQAISWELRAATSLARLWQSQGKRQEAYDLLAPVYGWFTEGFDTADLKDAKALLDDLA